MFVSLYVCRTILQTTNYKRDKMRSNRLRITGRNKWIAGKPFCKKCQKVMALDNGYCARCYRLCIIRKEIKSL